MPGSDIQPILQKVLDGGRLTAEECTALLQSYDVAQMGAAADEIRRRRHPDNIVTYIIDRNINYTNVCNVVCTFCAFYRRPGAPDTYVRTIDEISEKIDETIALGGTGVLMQGGLHPDFGVEWYEDLLRTLRAKYPGFQLHCFSPPEIHNLHLISGLDYDTIMWRLKEAGLYSLPGGGAEILDDEVRKRVATKCTTDEWLAVMRAVHRVGLRSSATMMFGIGDRIEHQVRHLQRIRDLQALLRREHQKQLDSGVDHLLLLVADSKHNRTVIRDAGQVVGEAFPLGTRAVLAKLGRGEAPHANGVAIL